MTPLGLAGKAHRSFGGMPPAEFAAAQTTCTTHANLEAAVHRQNRTRNRPPIQRENTLSDTTSHPACEHHPMAAARHIAAAYHHFQALAALSSCSHDQAQTHTAHADAESTAAHKCSMMAGQQSHKEVVAKVLTDRLTDSALQ